MQTNQAIKNHDFRISTFVHPDHGGRIRVVWDKSGWTGTAVQKGEIFRTSARDLHDAGWVAIGRTGLRK